MQTTKQEYQSFLSNNFRGLKIRKGLFYNWSIGLRFDLQVGRTDTEDYFKEVIGRASTLFETAFDKADNIFFALIEYKHKRRKIRFGNYAFRQVRNLDKSKVAYFKVKHLYEDNRFDQRNVAVTKLTVDRINYKNLFTAIGNSDFTARKPRLDNESFSSKEIYFINIDKELILNMYDDRGLDIIASNIETLRPIYTKHNDWILDYDRHQIDKHFAKQNGG